MINAVLKKASVYVASDTPEACCKILVADFYSIRLKVLFSQNFIFFTIYDWAHLSRLFVPGMPFQPSLMFASQVWDYLSEAPFKCSTLG